ncbi:MAG TPA: extracellular solute-binding protein [Candidatus Paceibacterota bacterium]|nr:extracellular solute-binding protein [Candidatus Paceibacterota bacterium]
MNLSSYLTSNRLVYILIGGIAFLVFVTLIVIVSNFGGGGGGQAGADLTFWGTFDDVAVMDGAIREYQRANPGVKVLYSVFPYADYERELVNALAAGTGPDIFMAHHTWLPKHGDKMLAAPERVAGEDQPFFTVAQFRNTFVDVAEQDLTAGGLVYAMPLYMDTLALYYNRDVFGSAGVALPPATWQDFLDVVPKLVIKDENFNIVQAAVPLGTARNVNRSTDILMMLMLQNGVRMVNDQLTQATFSTSVDGQPVGENALTFYTQFAMPTQQVYTWNDAQDYSVDAFAAGKAAMMLNYSHQIPLIRAKNPRLNFTVAPAPQHNVADARTYASYFAVAVSRQTASPAAAWRFVRYLTAGDGTVTYLNASLRPSARRDLIDQQQHDTDLGVFARQALTARSWFQVDSTAIETIFADMIENVILGRQTVRQALQQAQSAVSVRMSGR